MEGDNHDVDERDDADETTTMGGATPARTGRDDEDVVAHRPWTAGRTVRCARTTS